MLLLRRAARPLVSRRTTPITTRWSLATAHLSLAPPQATKQVAWATSATDWCIPLDLSTKAIIMPRAKKTNKRKREGHYIFIPEEECDLAMVLIAGDYQDKLVEKLTERYDFYSGPLIPDNYLVRQNLVVCAYIAWVAVAGCRPESYKLIKVDDVKVIISPAAPANRGEDMFELDDDDTHVVYVEYQQCKSRLLYEQPLSADKPWEEKSIELIHRFLGDARFSRSADDLLFNLSTYGKCLAKEILTSTAILCGVGAELTLKGLRILFACTTAHDAFEDFIKTKRYHKDNNKRGIRPGSRGGGRKCSYFLARTLKNVSIRLGHSFEGGTEKLKLAPYLDPRLVVHFAHDMGFHRNTLSSLKYLTGASRGIEHPWLSDSDEDDDDYKKAEDTWGDEDD